MPSYYSILNFETFKLLFNPLKFDNKMIMVKLKTPKQILDDIIDRYPDFVFDFINRNTLKIKSQQFA